MKRTSGNTPRQVQHSVFPACMLFVSPPPPSWEVLSELKQSYWVHTDVSLVCSSLFISLSISQIASRHPAQLCFFTLRIRRYPNRLMCPSRRRGAGSDVRRVCLLVDVSTLIQTSLFSSHLSAPVVALSVKMDLCFPKKGGKQYIFLFVETDGYTLKFNTAMQEEMSQMQRT